MDTNTDVNYWMRAAGAAALGMLALFLLVAVVGGLKYVRYIGSGIPATNTINVSGEGEVFAVPDIATFSFTVEERAKDVKAAQETATKKSNDIIAYLKEQAIESRDIQTTDYSVYPQYEYQSASCPASSSGVAIYCPPGKQVLTGYQVSQTVTVKVRNTAKAGDILSGIGSRGVSQVSGLDFTVDEQKTLEEQARAKAIADAREKAERLAKDLGVRIVRVVGFNESGVPIYYAKAEFSMAADARGGAANQAAPSPELPTGQNKITSNVTVTYEVR